MDNRSTEYSATSLLNEGSQKLYRGIPRERGRSEHVSFHRRPFSCRSRFDGKAASCSRAKRHLSAGRQEEGAAVQSACMSNERSYTHRLFLPPVPDLRRHVPADGANMCGVRRECARTHGIRMALQCRDALARGCIPHAASSVTACCSNLQAAGRKNARERYVSVASQC